ncbi:hypothetical protein ACTVH1_10275 [Gluconobacter cerinus]
MGLRAAVVNDDELRRPHDDQNAGAILKRRHLYRSGFFPTYDDKAIGVSLHDKAK